MNPTDEKSQLRTPLARKFATSIASVQTGIRINTDEIPDTLGVLTAVAREGGYVLRVWDACRGLQCDDQHDQAPVGAPAVSEGPLPPGLAELMKQQSGERQGLYRGSALALVQALLDQPPAPDPAEKDDYQEVIVVAKNLHLALDGPARELLVATIQHVIEDGVGKRKYLVGLMPAEAKLPAEIAPLFATLDHGLPDEAELRLILAGIAADGDEGGPAEEAAAAACKAALGLTRLQAERAFSASLADFGEVRRDYVWKIKAETLNAEGLVELRESPLTFADVGGLDGCKDFLGRILRPDPLEAEDADARYKGVCVVGPPGTGKTLLAYATGNEFGIPTLLANPGNLMGQYVGETERNTRKFFSILERLAPAVCVIDEVGQVMPSGDAGGDSGVSKRLLGTFLTKLNDMTAPVFWFFTSNDVENLHEAFLRAERIDAKFYVRLPDAAQRAKVWAIYLRKFFPEKVGGKPDPRHVPLDVDAILTRLRKKMYPGGTAKTKKEAADAVDAAVRDRAADVDRLLAALMALDPGSRHHAMVRTEEADPRILAAVMEITFSDEGWTPAEIRSCCRLARRLQLPLHQAARRVGHVCLGEKGNKILRRLDRWALNEGALDAETGELFVGVEPAAAARKAEVGAKARPRVKPARP